MEKNNENDKELTPMQEWRNAADEFVKLEIDVLDAYFRSRSPLPKKSVSGVDYMPDDKSTMDIVDDLNDMVEVEPAVVLRYMQLNGYDLTTDVDGKVKWNIWRNFNFPA